MASKKSEYKYATDLPIYRQGEKLLEGCIDAENRIKKSSKYSIGCRLSNKSLDILDYISLAHTYPDNRIKYVTEIVRLTKSVENLLKFASEHGLFGEKSEADKQIFNNTYPVLASMNRQAVGWLRSVNSKDANFSNPDFLCEHIEE